MGFYKFTADNAPISSNVATPDVTAHPAGTQVKVGKTKNRAKTNVTTKDTLSPDQITAKLEKVE